MNSVQDNQRAAHYRVDHVKTIKGLGETERWKEDMGCMDGEEEADPE